ncbi:MAG: PspC domain-containing protein [Mucilaginibacter sp.]
MEKKLYRDEYHKKIAGVCAGLAEYFNVDVTLIRVLFVLTLILKGGGVIVYIVLWIVLPVKNYLYNNPIVDYKVPPSPFGSTPPFDMPSQNPGEPFVIPPVRHKSNGTIIAGAILIVLGSFFLLDEFDIIPDWDFERLWPLILIAIGAVFMVTHGKKQPWEKEGWNATTPPAPDDADKKDEAINNDNPSTPIV